MIVPVVMILSFRHRFVFIRPRKVAGTSVEMALSTLCGDDDIVPAMIAVDERQRQSIGGFSGNYSANRDFERLYAQAVTTATPEQLGSLRAPPSRYAPHMAIEDIRAACGRPLDGFRITGIARNPYARVISFLHMLDHFDGYLQGEAMASVTGDLRTAFDAARASGRFAALGALKLYGDAQAEWLRYETLERDLVALFASLGTAPPPLPHAKRGALSDRLDPIGLFRRDQIDWINVHFAAEFDAFGYSRC